MDLDLKLPEVLGVLFVDKCRYVLFATGLSGSASALPRVS